MNYSTIEGCIRQSTNQPMRTEITPKDFKYINQPRNMIEEEEIYSGVDDNGIEVMLRKLDETSWIVDVRQQDDYIEGYEYENYSDALNQYNKLNESE